MQQLLDGVDLEDVLGFSIWWEQIQLWLLDVNVHVVVGFDDNFHAHLLWCSIKNYKLEFINN